MNNKHTIGLTAQDIAQYRLKERSSYALVFIDGYFVNDLSDIDALPQQIICQNLSQALVNHAELVNKYLQGEPKSVVQPFTRANDSQTKDGLFLFIPANLIISEPIHLLFINTKNADAGSAGLSNLFVIQKDSTATFFTEIVSHGDLAEPCNIFTRMHVGEHASLTHYHLQNVNSSSEIICNFEILQGQNSEVNATHINLGCKLSGNNLCIKLLEEKARCNIKGLYIVNDQQKIEQNVRVDHFVPNCRSDVLFKGTANDVARAIFSGRIVIHKNAQESEAHLTNKNLLLSDTAEIKTAPELEVYADGVRCSHGATVGQLDEQMLFYLRARGIDVADARKMLLEAFTQEVALHFIKTDLL